jgi:hypothetical protein|tara:strand:- start:5071 stop:5610 length:540 start_codon:yes stop_codon:yes gene_type:complete
MKKILVLLLSISLTGCSSENKSAKKVIDANAQLEKDLELYQNVWNTFLAGDTSVVNENNFTKDITIVTSQGDLVGIEATIDYYKNYLTGFSDIEWNIIDAFGQGDRIVKQWNFKGKHTGDFFGIPASGNYLDLSGTTIVTMKDGKIAKEHDFFDMKSLLDQLTKPEGEVVTIDEYQPVN